MGLFLVFADSHGDRDALFSAVDRHAKDVEGLIFLGDGEEEAREVSGSFPGLGFFAVSGNNDFGSSLPRLRTVPVGEGGVLITHGHRLFVKRGRFNLAALAKERGCTVALYGHTHIKKNENINGITLFCPGSINRYFGGRYALLSSKDNGGVEIFPRSL